MTQVSRSTASGRIVTLMHDSTVLKDNPLGDPTRRRVSVYLPAAYASARNRERRFVTLYDLAGFTGSGLSHLNWRNFDENLPEKLDIRAPGKMKVQQGFPTPKRRYQRQRK